MAKLTKLPKAPDAVLDYTEDWSLWLEADSINDSTWIVPTGMTEDSSSFDETTTTVWLEGGTLGESYVITNTISTLAGRTEDHSFVIVCEAK